MNLVRVQGNGNEPVLNLSAEGIRAWNIDCVAAGARPAPTFKWYIGGEEIKVKGARLLVQNTLTI